MNGCFTDRNNHIEKGGFGIAMIAGIRNVNIVHFPELDEIIEKSIGLEKHDIVDVQDEMIDMGLEQFAQP